MKIFFDDNKKVVAVTPDDSGANYPPANQIYCPLPIISKIEKTISVTRQQRNLSGLALFQQSNGVVTTDASTLGNGNHPLVETVPFTRSVGLYESPGEWTVEDVLNSKYVALAAGQDFWYCEFMDASAIDLDNSSVNTGFNGVSILPGGYLQFVPLKLAKKVSQLRVYIEAGQDRNKAVQIEVSTNGKTFGKVAELAKSADTFVFRVSDPQAQGISTPVHAFAVFY
jgi:hypothetical protein